MRKTIFAAMFAVAVVAPAAVANHYSDLYVLPVAARTTGLNNTPFATDVSLQNFSTSPLEVSFLFVQGGEGNAENVTNLVSTALPRGAVTIPAGGSVILRDILAGFTGAGANPFGAIIVSADRAFAVSSRAYTTIASGGTYGQTVLPVRNFIENTLGNTSNPGAFAYIPGLVQNTSYRSNLGFLAGAGPNGMTIDVQIRDANGISLGTKSFIIPANTFVQTQFSTVSVANATYDAGSAVFQITNGDGAVAPYASVVDSRTSDAVYINGVFPDNDFSALAERGQTLLQRLLQQRLRW